MLTHSKLCASQLEVGPYVASKVAADRMRASTEKKKLHEEEMYVRYW